VSAEPLKACPFCGFIDEAEHGEHPRPGLRVCADHEDNRDRAWWVECDNCLACGAQERNGEMARKEWNARPPRFSQEEREVLEEAAKTCDSVAAFGRIVVGIHTEADAAQLNRVAATVRAMLTENEPQHKKELK